MNSSDFDPNQIILIDKPAGISSFGVVARVRKYLTVKVGHKVKVGHCGTLDPFATGLMILVSGKYTKRAGEFSKLKKSYRATLRLGASSTTLDPEGEIIELSNQVAPSLNDIEATVASFQGKIKQRPPIFSAIKINGQRAYRLARQGKNIDIDMPLRTVEVYSFKINRYSYPDLDFTVEVSSGTYIRSLGQDIANQLGTEGYLTSLRRLSIDSYKVDQAVSLESFNISQHN